MLRNPVKKITKVMFERTNTALYFGRCKLLVYTAPGKVELEQLPRPEPQTGEEEIAIEVAGVCGSDISGFLGHSALRRPPLVLGHELVGPASRWPASRGQPTRELRTLQRLHLGRAESV